MSESQPKGRKRRQTKFAWKPETIRALREYMGLTQREMADELEVRQQTISEWETGTYAPRGLSERVLSLVAERADFAYEAQADVEPTANKQSS